MAFVYLRLFGSQPSAWEEEPPQAAGMLTGVRRNGVGAVQCLIKPLDVTITAFLLRDAPG